MATNLFLTLINNVKTLVQAISSSSGSGDADKIVATGSDGRIDVTLMPLGVDDSSKMIEASESLSAGNFINIHNSSGAKVRKANATDSTKPAHGFVIDNVSSGAQAKVYFEGTNSALSGLTPGTTYVLGTTGGAAVALASGPTSSGNIRQVLGVANDTGELEVELGEIIVRA